MLQMPSLNLLVFPFSQVCSPGLLWEAFRVCQHTFWVMSGTSGGPRQAQDDLRQAQARPRLPKTGPRWSRTRPRRSLKRLKNIKLSSKIAFWLPRPLKMTQDSPRQAQDAPKTGQDRPKTDPRFPQERHKTAQGRPPTIPDRPFE